MVRLIPIELNGKMVWIEDAPEACPAGHEELLPTWGPCPECRYMLRLWKCRAEGCDGVLYDDEHEHGRSRRA